MRIDGNIGGLGIFDVTVTVLQSLRFHEATAVLLTMPILPDGLYDHLLTGALKEIALRPLFVATV